MKRKIIVIDDEPVMSTLLKELVDEDNDLEISQMTTEKNEFLDALIHSSFDIALIDISVGEREGGLNILKILKDKDMGIPVIVLSAHDEVLYALKCLKAGAQGYISKDCVCTQLLIGLKKVLDGNLFVSGERGESILHQYKEFNDPSINISKPLP